MNGQEPVNAQSRNTKEGSDTEKYHNHVVRFYYEIITCRRVSFALHDKRGYVQRLDQQTNAEI